MIPVVIQLQSSFTGYEGTSFVQSGRRRWLPTPAACSPEREREEDAALRAAIRVDPQPNALVQCLDIGPHAAFDLLAELCARTPHVCMLPGRLDLPAHGDGPLLIGDVSMLTLQQQVELYDWLDRCRGAVQVISITSVPLWPLVSNGRFMEGLFYRLNVMSVRAAVLRLGS